jgi:hypothetical protein
MDTATPSTPAPPGIAERVRSVLIAMASSTLIPDVAGRELIASRQQSQSGRPLSEEGPAGALSKRRRGRGRGSPRVGCGLR